MPYGYLSAIALVSLAGARSPLLHRDVFSANSLQEPPKIAAIIALYNGRDFIEEALKSVLSQTLAPVDVIIVDDGSTDDGAAVAMQFANGDPRVRVLTKTNGGQSSARNHGVRSTDCDLIAFLDQDDWWYPRHLELLLRQFRKRRHLPLGWAYSDLDEYNLEGRLVVRDMLKRIGTEHPKRTVHACVAQDMYVLPSASLIAKAAFEAVNGFDERLAGYEDDDLFLRMFRAGYDNAFVPEPLSAWRIHGGSTSYGPRMARSGMVYAQKLLEVFPNETERARYYTRDLIAPRFTRVALSLYSKSLKASDRTLFALALQQLDLVRKHLSLGRRLVMSILRPFLGSYPVAKAASSFGRAVLFSRVWSKRATARDGNGLGRFGTPLG